MNKSNSEIQKWYNTYSTKQVNIGTNLRHYSIFNSLTKAGLKRNHNVLEIGCGIGTLTKLIAKYVKKGSLVATDISDESIEIAKKRISNTKNNIELLVSDMTTFSHSKKFDFVVLPDVLEHIPIEQHNNLFKIIAAHTHDNSIILINIPHPKALDYLRIHSPEKLQVIDQSISAKQLMDTAYLHDFELINYKSYSIFNKENDYALITYKKNTAIKLNPLAQKTIIYRKLIARIKYYLS